MPRQVVQTVENSFVNGLVSQGSGLNFPEKGCTDTDNCIFWEWGAVTRRLGIDFEDASQPLTVTRSDTAMSSFVWKNVADDANITLLVQQVGDTLYFWDAITYANISLGAIADTVDLNDFTPAGGTAPDRYECQFANGHGVLFVFHPYCEPFYVEYDADTQLFTATQITLEQRDFEGEPTDPYTIEERPVISYAGLDNSHKYNLLNQGWNTTNITTWDTARSDMPSNADIMYLFKNSSDVFDTTTVANVISGNTPAPRGHYILNVFNQDRITESGLSGLTVPTTGANRVSTGAFFAGRVWYSGLSTQSYKGSIYFSSVITSFDQFGQCYQKNDPTSEDFFDLLADDGGVLDIADAGTVHKLFATQTSLLVFASNGVWAISGSTGIGFTANDYSVSKLGDIPSISGSSFVNAVGYPVWWNYDGIYTITSEGGTLAPKNLSDKAIKSFFQNDIPDEAKLYARGCYNSLLKTIQWVYADGTTDTIDDNYNFNRVLTYNIFTGAFYPWSVEEADPRINGVVYVDSVPESVSSDTVVDSGGQFVIDSSGDSVVVYTKSGITVPRNVYVTTADYSGTTKLQFALQVDSTYYDWTSYVEAVDYTSYFITGYKLHGDGLKKFQPVYVILYAHTADEDISYVFQGLWDYATASGTNRWSSSQTVTHTDNNYAYSTKRLKLRGFGRALQFKVTSVAGSAFDLAGWAASEGINSNP